jgi:hypothetical protein
MSCAMMRGLCCVSNKPNRRLYIYDTAQTSSVRRVEMDFFVPFKFILRNGNRHIANAPVYEIVFFGRARANSKLGIHRVVLDLRNSDTPMRSCDRDLQVLEVYRKLPRLARDSSKRL